ncbi:MAG: dTDP-4-dehydrorhamnose 3,5-epimerase [Piscirickettsiaceae bacterium CG_4_9_14_3_um_filter_43_564]|nr:dTDP-4-dehydrorhamnose 3,5-epimerase [Thiomicrospira sp.]OIP94481.1 MAG: dTDP-4-dehydrorhamnose 3,5-epimerase [Thiomicrospira sp. CG2_30_44_34]PIQ04433.1 MAG: dTDP-4-dehydrorhamnose 3,5-epimerase [Piscirickettsiaceae bacterium CG18_big_fil_WC_8_21_14_2_50_44_103]PIU39230.1 MAG: dTDP-4-dehydrorhamnose 3,5-epimerase [Piscirickettsiaceae bacterium CG07_land_8_20_14_0_80_44_28]PIW58256.1 MAG: dTDP-4-dehydrorhamnose 3,5-epimerase [Piscirickettsiaceae bacterium CG12_big_fil_rev_8_21_14_0_65_44_934
MQFIPQAIPDVILIQPKVHGDHRGYFVETFRQDQFEEALGYQVNFCQDNESKSIKGVLRGLHFQLPPFAQSKLVRVIEGEVLDVAVDIRQGSPTFGQHVAILLNETNKHQLFIPRGFAHGFLVLSDTAIFAYKVDNYYSPECDRGLAFDDPALNIDWMLAKDLLKLSEKDQKQPGLVDLGTCFEFGVDYYA